MLRPTDRPVLVIGVMHFSMRDVDRLAYHWWGAAACRDRDGLGLWRLVFSLCLAAIWLRGLAGTGDACSYRAVSCFGVVACSVAGCDRRVRAVD